MFGQKMSTYGKPVLEVLNQIAYIFYFFDCALKDTFTAKNSSFRREQPK